MTKKKAGVLPRSFSKTFAAIFVFGLLNIAVIFSSQGQDQTNFTQFYLNPALLNSSYTGFDGQPSVSLIYRKQWMTIDGAPTIASASLQAPLNNRVSAGINVTNDSKGFFSNSGLLFSVAYHVPLRDHTFVRFGISAGGSWNTVDMKKLDAVNDPALAGVLDKNASLAGNAGASFHHKSFNLGIALPGLFFPAYVSEDAFNVKEVKPFQALIVHASNRFYLNNDKNIFEPYAVYRINTGLPSQLELAGLIHLNHVLWAGASYKEDFGVSALGGIKLKNTLAIGASWSIQQGGLDELNSPSFEVSLNYLFGPRKRGVPVYSFVNAVKVKERKQSAAAQQALAASQKHAEEEKKNKAEAAAKLKKEQEERRILAAKEEKAREETEQEMASARAREKQAETEVNIREGEERAKQEKEALARRNAGEKERAEAEVQQRRNMEAQEKSKEEGQAEKRGEIAAATQPPVSSVKDLPEGHPQHEARQIQKIQSHAEDPHRTIPDAAETRVRHETFRRGDHEEELQASEYVIAGVFKSLANAKHFSDGLRNLDFNSHYGYLTPKDLWYVYVTKTTDYEHARAEQARLRKKFLFKDVWLLTVQP